MTISDPVHQRIEQLISSEKVVLFMKGTAQMPQCGFSARTVQALDTIGVAFTTVDVLSDPEIRQGIKDFSEWPTIPQLYVDKEFIGGCDIVTQMMGSGELHTLLGVTYEPPAPPEMVITDAFAAAIQAAQADGAQGQLRLQVSPNWEYGIGFSALEAGDLEVEANGLKILVDAASAKRADGIRLDFQEGTAGGVIVDNPNEPPAVRRLPVQGLQQMMAAGRPIHLFDVRTPEEWSTARIEGATLVDEAGYAQLMALPKDAMIVMYCHHGIRSMQAAGQLLEAGFRNVFNLEGGIDAWSDQVDASVPRY